MSLQIAIIGCGTVTELRHLPALSALNIVPTLLVDTNLQQARDLAERFGVSHISAEYNSGVNEFDAAIIALPHYLHASVGVDLLRRGVHVLVEKPMALTVAESNAMISAAEEGKAILAAGLMRRFIHAVAWVKAALAAGVLGAIESFDFKEGTLYTWPMSSGFFLRRETSGGGVLIDTGAHILDLLLWWLGEIVSFKYFDDSYGGVEANCELHLTLASGARGVVELSRVRRLPSTAILRGQRGEIEVSLNKNQVDGRPKEILAYRNGPVSGYSLPQQSFDELFVLQIRDWLRAIEERKSPLVPGAEAVRSIALIEECYKQREPLEFPWIRPEQSRAQAQ